MADISLPALDVRPPAAPQNPLEQYAQLMGLRRQMMEQPLEMQQMQQQVQGSQMENEQRQLQLQDQLNLRKAAQGIDWTDPDAYTKFMQGAEQSGVSPMTLQQIAMQRAQYQKTVAQTSQAQNQVNLQRNNMLLGHIDSLEEIQDPQKRAQAARVIGQQILQDGSAQDPNTQQLAKAMASGQLVPTDDQLQMFGDSLKDHNTVISDALKVAQTNSARYKVVNGTLYDMSGKEPKPALQGQLNPQAWNQAVDSVVPPTGGNAALNQRTHAQVNFYLQTGNIGAAQKVLTQAAQQMGEIGIQTNPEVEAAKIRVAEASGAARAQQFASYNMRPVYDNKTGQTTYMNAMQIEQAEQEEPGRFTVPEYTPQQVQGRAIAAASGSSKTMSQITSFNTASAHLDTLQNLALGLKNGNIQLFNEAAQRLGVATGQAPAVRFEAAKNAVAGEIAQALKTSGATDDEIRNVASTFNRAQSPTQLVGAIQTYKSLLGSKINSLRGQVQAGAEGKANFGPSEGQGTGAGGGKPLTITLPSGKKVTIE